MADGEERTESKLGEYFPGWQDWPVEKKEELLKRVRYIWHLWARDEQLPPEDDEWDIWMVLAGRGFGKTRRGAEWVVEELRNNPGWRCGIIAATYADGRDTCIEGESGILACLRPEEMNEKAGFKYNRSLGQIRFANGSRIKIFSGNDPEKLRGPQHHLVWMDELASWQYSQETWDHAMLGLRLGTHPRVLISTTPKPVPIIKELVGRWQDGDPTVTITKGWTFDNAANLAGTALRSLLSAYDGTPLGRQELYAELISDAPGALWTRDLLERQRIHLGMTANGRRMQRVQEVTPDLVRIVVAIDPAVSKKKRSNFTGIVVCALGADGKGYVLEDLTMKGGPDAWAATAIRAYKRYHADRLVAEANNGGDMVEYTLRTIDPNIPLKIVYASRGQIIRAEPRAGLYEQDRIYHVGMFSELEDQLTSWVPGTESPDRLDAMVWGFTELMLKGGVGEVYVATPNTAGTVPAAGGAQWSRGFGAASPASGGQYAAR